MREEIHQLLNRLRFRGIAHVLDQELDRSERQAAPPSEVLLRLLQEEENHRREQSLAYRIKKAKLLWDWTIDSFPFAQQPGVNKAQIRSLAG